MAGDPPTPAPDEEEDDADHEAGPTMVSLATLRDRPDISEVGVGTLLFTTSKHVHLMAAGVVHVTI
jgi:hypothetical protein